MRLLSTIFLSSLFLISCSNDDDGNGFQDGWNETLVNELSRNCVADDLEGDILEEGVDVDLDCDCLANETAKFAPLSKFTAGLSQKEEVELGLIIIKNCSK